ncbi:NAD(P)-dependent oxidoreductase [uncultured Phenylobacterium sp.]|uniref:NAD-dependent epimerase/dehydratase family protein n=1 Tax=uncultured Phenylobacterium sp. TaxID=349273 RepID=UPI0025DEA039|nr:NAD(P)-dependent oxidoreductase [uncultured Phenylobacterium sp.]
MGRRVLLTGGSSFTGLWIAEALAQAGFEVLAPLLRERSAYEGVRLERVRRLERCADVTFARPFGSDALLCDIRASGGVDVLAHHAAHITNYRDPAFDAADAVARNTNGLPATLAALRDAGAGLVILTGSIFEAGEGGDGPAAPWVTPYGLSKTLTREAFDDAVGAAGLRFARFVIPSPYGPFEERRFGWHLFRSWFAGETPLVRTPLYIRDHLPAPQLAAAYVACLTRWLADDDGERVARPSGWIASQGDFAARVAAEAARRLAFGCPLEMADQSSFDEPRVRVNADPGAGGDETAFWDDYVGWYANLHARGELV